MRIYGLEEHMATADVIEAWKLQDPQLTEPMMRWAVGSDVTPALLDLDDGRLAAMDDAGIDTAVLSLTTPGLQNLAAAEAVALQRPTNDAIAAAVRRHPERLQGFATLAMPAPVAAATELRRAVTELGLNGALVPARSGDRTVDAPAFWDVYEAAAHLRAPVYLHPRAPVPVVGQAYYSGFDEPVNSLLATGAFGWHYDAGLTVLRMIVSGLFDRFPDLQVILGHWGEVVLFYLDRIAALDRVTRLQRPVAEYFRSNIFITPGGISSHKYLRWSLETVGAERLMYASDYPFNRERDGSARRFLDTAPLSDAEREGIAFRTWEKLVAGIRR
ncbi:amidohydrolase family protein [Streptantibioticus silvisoli]|uniref:Amidohydrolase family protein n=1 Tax=Streptantibioticus silvisoli TaxID=2705255 RepID=A0ABT6VUK6_9ACTN|nr:amidohydrolase family protein [Streptantibioticus silvisoli]MDI5962137.1 amidohydrolase family protein [Streptantibioticus silvisoli]